MIILCWDASALAKRYAPEVGSDAVDALFTAVPASQQLSASISYAEIYSILLRKFNRSLINRAALDASKSSLRTELIYDPDFVLLSIDDAALYSGIALMEAHNINATDAALLTLFLRYISTYPTGSPMTFVLIAADQRLVRAAQAEGILAIDPETLSIADVTAFLASL